jgi:hypothetical protein
MDQLPAPKKKREIKKKDPYAYTITDASFGELKVRNSANAWWMDRPKLDRLITAYKNGHNDKEARVYAGITERHLEYFQELHPEFCAVKEDCRQMANIIARKSVVGQMTTDGNLAFKWLEKKVPDEFGQKNNIGIAVQVNVGERMKEIKDKYSK